MKLIGIDPGKSGGLCCIENDNIIEICVMPTYEQKNGKDIIDFKAVSEFIKKHNPDKIYLEKVGAMSKQGVSSMFNFGVSFGGLMATCLVLDYEMVLVTPQKWKKEVLGENYNHEDKNGTIQFCQMKFPNTNLLATKRSRVPHDGICDAIAIAYYGSINKEEKEN